ncbi:Prefoldin subunit 3 [Trametes versicolor FP-101664 SS1]|uniref:Prefoldin subunit 3 n=1 Tax=Trametes versicolor (strain FP-101664) TaxID=717944 RepID=UPI000462355A|nr:Prefoldin subunit 3 [Trametes versicolor FP-101664 SS1]EIW56753.1 Prefoldin subunit 3 [Trametes versicolor FP-101664 SS1]
MSKLATEKQERNPRGIPKAPFIADVAEFLGPSPSPEEALKEFQAALAVHVTHDRKYRYMDQNLTQRRRGLEEKIPDIKKTLAMVEFLQERREGKSASDSDRDDLDDEDLEDDSSSTKPLVTTYELNDTLYAEAELEDTDTVFLWLGTDNIHQANVMLSYKLPAAVALLRSKLDSAQSSLATVIEDLEFLREQITVMEVNTARVYNWDVKRRRELREKEAKEGKTVEAKVG